MIKGKGILDQVRDSDPSDLKLKPITYEGLKEVVKKLDSIRPRRIWHASLGTVKHLLDVGGVNAFKLFARDYDEVIMGTKTYELLKEYGCEFGKERV